MPACLRGSGSTPVPLAYFDTNFMLGHMRQASHDHFHSSASASDSVGTSDSMLRDPWDCNTRISLHMACCSGCWVIGYHAIGFISSDQLCLAATTIASDSSSTGHVLTSSK